MDDYIVASKIKLCKLLSLRQDAENFATKYNIVLFWIVGILYKVSLDALYIWVAHPLYGYAGLVYIPSFVKYIITTVMYLLIFWGLPRKECTVSGYLLHFQFIYTVAPMLTFCALGDGSIKYMLMVCMCILLEVFIVSWDKKKIKPVYIIGIKSYVTVVFGVLLIVTLIVPILYNGFAGLKAFDFNYIYEMRENATYPPGFTYLFFWMGKAIIPFATILFLEKKKYALMVAAVIIQVFLYIECGNKFLLFILLPAVAVYFCAKTGHLIKIIYLGLTILFTTLIPAYRMDLVGGHALGVSGSFYVAVRSVFHPAENKFAMYECFNQYPKMYFGKGLIGKMLGLTDLYKGSEGQIIYAYSGGTFLEANYNSGYLGEAYAQLGFCGMVLMAVLFAYIVKIVGVYDSKKTFCFLAAIFSIYIIYLGDISLLTTLLSSGLFIIILMLTIYLNKEKGE